MNKIFKTNNDQQLLTLIFSLSPLKKIRKCIDLPEEMYLNIFQFISCEKSRSNISLANHQFRSLLLRCCPYRNYMAIAFNFKTYGLSEFDVPSLVEGEKLSPMTIREFYRITNIGYSETNNFSAYAFLTHNKNLPLEISTEFVKGFMWDLKDCENISYTQPLASLCKKLLNGGYTREEEDQMNDDPLLFCALNNVKSEGCSVLPQLIYKQKRLPKKPVNWSSKIEVMIQVAWEGSRLKNANENLKNDTGVVLTAFSSRIDSLEYADKSFKEHEDFMLNAIFRAKDVWMGEGARVFTYADESLKNNKSFVLKAIEKNPRTLIFVNSRFKKDKDVVLAAIKKDYKLLEYADITLKGNKEFVLKGIEGNSCVYKYIDDSFKNDKEFALEAIKLNREVYEYLDESLKNDEEILLAAGRELPQSFCTLL